MKLLLALVAATLGYCYYRGLEAKRRKVAVKDDLTRWEGEGGNVPTVATPSPAVTPSTSVPPSPAVRH